MGKIFRTPLRTRSGFPGIPFAGNPVRSGFCFFTVSVLFSALLAACSFDYGPQGAADDSQPDIVMDNVEYVRMRNADPVARFQAERAERYEGRRIMELRNFSFEQFGNHGSDVNAYGQAGSASVELESLDIRMDDGVRIEVESEDFSIATRQLEWKDKERTLTGGPGDEVNVLRANGTMFTGVGFSADARRKTWEFANGVNGTYIHDDEEEGEETAESETAGTDTTEDGIAEDMSGADAGDEAAFSGEDTVMPAEDMP
jgi:LPS export ABC transporter protein LptC